MSLRDRAIINYEKYGAMDRVFRDITEDKRMQKHSEQILNSIVETVADMIYRLDGQGIITLKKYGYSAEELI